MNETTTLIEKIIEGIQEKKGKQIVVADLNEIEDTICKYFIIPAKKPMPPFLSPTGKYVPAESALMFPLILFPVSVLRNI